VSEQPETEQQSPEGTDRPPEPEHGSAPQHEPDTLPDQDAEPPGNGITTPLDGE
jgi:hypothetical protein